MSSEGDRAAVLRTTTVRTKLRGDGSWLQRRDEPQAETQEEEMPWLAEVRARRLNGAPIETSPVSSPVKATPPPVKSDTQSKPATQGYLIRGVFTKLEKPASTPSSNGTSTTKTFTKKPSETYKRIAPHIVRNTSENPEGQLSLEEQERRTEAALHVMKTKAAKKRSYVLSAAKLYETKDTQPDTSLATSGPSFMAKRVEIFDDVNSAAEPSPAVPPTSAASAPAPKPQSASSTDTIAALSNTLISLDTNPSSAENDKQELAEEEGGPVDSPTPEDSVEQEPDTAPRDGEPITGDLLGFSDGLSVQQQEEEKQTDETAVETQSSADPFDPNPIGTASHNSPPDLFEPSADVFINSSATTEETMESPTSEESDCIMAIELPELVAPNIPKPMPIGVEQVVYKFSPIQYEPTYKMEEDVPIVVEKQLHHYFLEEEKVEEEDEGNEAGEEEENDDDEEEGKAEEEEENEEEKVEEENEENEEDKVEEEEENEEEKVEEEEENEEDKVQEEEENEEEEKVEEEEKNEEEEKVEEEDEEKEKVEEEEEDEGKVEEDEEEDQKVEAEDESEEEKDEEKDKESSQGSWNTTWEIPHEASTVESQETETEDKAGDQQTVIMFERKSTENDSPWDKWMTPTVYTISTGTEDGDEEEVKEEERPAVVAEEQRVPTPEPESKKPFVYVKEYVDASESLLNLRDPLNGSDDFTSSSISYSYSSPSSYTRLSPSSTCTYCGKQVGNDAKISIEHLNINCHPDCFKCDVCSRPMGDLLHSMFLHNQKVHCESCYATVI
uniref:LIM zinc-binding domain-containing protein n=1 Tax=Poecilia latipinna TaxID=48699 RepID=A0A3B3U8R7_9TELE